MKHYSSVTLSCPHIASKEKSTRKLCHYTNDQPQVLWLIVINRQSILQNKDKAIIMQLYEKPNMIQPCKREAQHAVWEIYNWNFLFALPAPAKKKVYSFSYKVISPSKQYYEGMITLKIQISTPHSLFSQFMSLGLTWSITGQYQNVASDVNLHVHICTRKWKCVWVSEGRSKIIMRKRAY